MGQKNEVKYDNSLEICLTDEESIRCLSKFKWTKRVSIYSQILELFANRTRYFKYSHCAQKCELSNGTRNIAENLTKNHDWNGSTSVQRNRKREKIGIEDALIRWNPSDNGQKTERMIKFCEIW